MFARAAFRRGTGLVGGTVTRWSVYPKVGCSSRLLSPALRCCCPRSLSTVKPTLPAEDDKDGASSKTAAANARVAEPPLEDLLGRDPTSRPDVVLYQNHQKWKVRSFGAFAVSQGSYWAFVAYDTTKKYWQSPPLDAASQVDASGADVSTIMDPLAIAFVTHPGWAVFGAGFAVSLFGVVHLVSSHLIAQVAIPKDKGVGYLEVITHDYMGQPSQPKSWRAGDMEVHSKYLEAASKDTFVGILAPGFKTRFLLETDMGVFAPHLKVVDSEGNFVRGSTLQKLVEETRISVVSAKEGATTTFRSSIVDRFDKNDKNKRGRKRR
jgi:hypothetical protein